jgi:hypothetical protein
MLAHKFAPVMSPDLDARRSEFQATIRMRLERVRGNMPPDEFDRLIADVVGTAERFAAIEH